MNRSASMKYGAALAALAFVSACSPLGFAQGGNAGDGMPVSPSSIGAGNTYSYMGRTLVINGRPVTAERPPDVAPGYEMLLPDAGSGMKYEYIFNNYNSYSGIFDWPKSDHMIGKIKGAGGQGCTNVLYGYGKKTFWNVGGEDQITLYSVPKTPVRKLSVNYSFPSSCAMDAGGDLAVGILYNNSGSGGGDVIIFKDAKGKGIVYPTPLDEEFFDGYDPQGDLYADGFTRDRSGFAFVGLLKGSGKFVVINTSNSVDFPGSVQWDGTYVTVFDQHAEETYRYTISGKKATLEGTVKYTGTRDCAQTWIVTGYIFCADAGHNDGYVFKYPAGGKPIARFRGIFDNPLGVTAAEN